MNTKICSKCKIKKDVSEFYIRTDTGKLRNECKVCVSKYHKQYMENKDNKEIKKKYCRNRYQENKEKANKQSAEYYQKHKKEAKEYSAKHYQEHKRYLQSIRKKWRKDNKEKLFEQRHSPVDFDVYAYKIAWVEKIDKDSNNKLLVRCAYCGKFHAPTKASLKNRISALNGKQKGEARLYCSDACKKSCPSYKQRKYWKGQKQGRLGTSREVDAWFRQFVLETDNWTCQKCFKSKDEYPEITLHVHHLKGVAQQPLLQNDIDNAITLCIDCHKEIHQKTGCTYYDLRRSECKV